MSRQGFWDEDLIELQQRYWQRWSEISGAAGGQDAGTKSPWEMAQAHWWQAIAPGAPDSAKEFMARMLEQGSQYFRMAGLFAGEGGDAEMPWTEILDRLSEQMSSASSPEGAAAGSKQMQKLMGFWALPSDNWQQLAATLAPGYDGLFEPPGAGGSSFSMDRILKMPGFGYAREEQAGQQKLLRLVAEHQRALQAYNQFFTGIGSEAVERLRVRLQQMGDDGRAIGSGRELYDIWVSVCEDVYGERVITEDFARTNGELVNSAMRVKQQLGRMADDFLGSHNMPTRRELRTLQTRLQDIRRENKHLRSELEMVGTRLAQLEAAAGPAQAGRKKRTAKVTGKRVTKKRSGVQKKRTEQD